MRVRFWLLKVVARWMGLTVQMTAYRHVSAVTPALTSTVVTAVYHGVGREVRCVVFATDALVAVESMLTLQRGVDASGHGTVQ